MIPPFTGWQVSQLGCLWLWNGTGFSRHYKLLGRCKHHLCCLYPSGQLSPTFLLWRRNPALHYIHVPKPRYSVGVLDPSIPSSPLCTFPLPILQIRYLNSRTLQVRL
jgi:hypothetical protein